MSSKNTPSSSKIRGLWVCATTACFLLPIFCYAFSFFGYLLAPAAGVLMVYVLEQTSIWFNSRKKKQDDQ